MSFSVPGAAPLSLAHHLLSLPGAAHHPPPLYIYIVFTIRYFILYYYYSYYYYSYYFIIRHIHTYTHTHTHTHTHTQMYYYTHILINFIYFNCMKIAIICTPFLCAPIPCAISLSRASVSLAILSFSLARVVLAILSFSLSYALPFSLSHALSCAIIVLSLSYARRYHSLTYLCVVLLPPMQHLTMRRPCRMLMSSLSHVDAILVVLSSSHT